MRSVQSNQNQMLLEQTQTHTHTHKYRKVHKLILKNLKSMSTGIPELHFVAKTSVSP